MAIASKRGFRSMLSRTGRAASPYAHLKEEEDAIEATVKKMPTLALASSMNVVDITERRPVMVSVTTSIDDTRTVHGGNNIIICSNVYNEEEKESESDDDVFETTQKATIALVRDASSMTDLVTKRLALSRSFPPFAVPIGTTTLTTDISTTATSTTAVVEEEKTENDAVVGETSVEQQSSKEQDKTETAQGAAVWNCGKTNFLERSKDGVVKAQTATHLLFEAGIGKGKAMMASTEAASQAIIFDKLPLFPLLEHTSELLEHTSEQLEQAFHQTKEEAREFFLDHRAMLRDFIAYASSKTTKRPKPSASASPRSLRVPAASTASNEIQSVSIEVQMF